MSELTAYARVYGGQWVADCPRPGCPNAEHFGRAPVTGHVGGLTGTVFRCGTTGNPGTCGLTCRAVWPPNVEDIERLLAQRPAPASRNWFPGEDVHDLLLENVAHGLLPVSPGELEGVPDGPLLEIQGDHIVAGSLPGPSRLPQLEAGA